MIRILIIDPSPAVRRELGTLISRQPDLVCLGGVSSPAAAQQRVRHTAPDVIISSVPIRAGTFSCPVVSMCAQRAVKGASPSTHFSAWLERHGKRLLRDVRVSRSPRAPAGRVFKMLAIGSSTGGPPALECLLQGLGSGLPGIIISQHMEARFTRAFADRLNQTCPQTVQEARSGQPIRPGEVLVAPGNLHLCVAQRSGRLVVVTSDRPLVNGHRPSVDVMFQSVAAVVGAGAVGIILTGMGRDGAQGLLEMRAAGALTIAQDEASSVVFGMPGAAVELGAVGHVLPLKRIASRVRSRVSSEPRRQSAVMGQ